MTCLSESEMVEFTSMFFVGFAAGLVLFPMPEKLGIKKTMSILMPLFCVFSGLSVFGQSIHLKEVGLFMQGFMHMKIMLAYSHMFELTDETNKGFCAMVIQMIDISALIVQGIIFMSFSKNAVLTMQVYWAIGTIATILYIFFVPESPRWLFINN